MNHPGGSLSPHAGLAHLGVMQLTCFMAGPLVRSGALVRVLEDWDAEAIPVYVVYPPNRHLSSKLRVFVDWVAELFARHTVWQKQLIATCDAKKGNAPDDQAIEPNGAKLAVLSAA